jgi:Cysteine-rich CWC
MFTREKRCAACGEPFTCGGLWFCWCRQVKLDAITLQQMRQENADCLCLACLERYADRTSAMSINTENS